MKRTFLLSVITLVFLLGVAASGFAGAKTGSGFDRPSFFQTGDRSVGVGYLGAWAGGIDFTGSYFFTRNWAAQADIGLMSYNFGPGNTASFTYIDILGVYHMSFNNQFGGYAGLGLAMGSATGIGGQTFTVGSLAYTLGVEMPFNNKIKGHLGILSGGINLGVDMEL